MAEETIDQKSIAQTIDHTLLKPEASESDIIRLCAEAREYSFAAVCVHPWAVKRCAHELQESSVKVCTVIGFPSGATLSYVKRQEALACLQEGAVELDMVINLGLVKSGNWEAVRKDIAEVCHVTHEHGALVKVILETSALSDDEIIHSCEICRELNVDFVKTSTGFGAHGATVEAVRLMRETVGAEIGVKASGGIRDLSAAQAMIAAGATRLGTSSGVSIVSELSHE